MGSTAFPCTADDFACTVYDSAYLACTAIDIGFEIAAKSLDVERENGPSLYIEGTMSAGKKIGVA